MTTWNYRIIKQEELDGHVYVIGRVYYEEGKPMGWSEASPCGTTLRELKQDAKMMEEAFYKPVLLENMKDAPL